ncbi:MAG: PAS domain S-box protein [Chloroflexi bacterium]|nr:PAS domain S-box protein [Chloroflexota bacterium]
MPSKTKQDRSSTDTSLHQENALAETNRILEAILDHTPTLVACLDPQFNFVQVNRAYAEADEREPSFFPGKNHFDLYPNVENKEIFRRVVETGEPYYMHAKPFEYADRPERGVTCWDWSLVPIKDSDDTITGLVLTVLNTTERVQIEQALRESKETARALLDAPTDTAILINLEGTILALNETAAHRFGARVDELVGVCGYDLLPPDLAKSRKIWVDKVVHSGEPVRFEDERAGIIFDSHIHPVFNAQGQVARLAVFGRDITEHKQIENALRKNEKRFRLLYEETPLGYQSLNKDGYLIEVNQAWLDTLGYSREEVIGRWFGEFLTSEYMGYFKERFPRFKAAGETRDVEFEMVRKDGSHVIVSINGRIGYDRDEEFRQTHCVLYDITKRKKMETALQKRNRELALLNQAARVFSSSLDLDQVFATVLEEVRRQLDVIACSIWLIDLETDDLVCQQATGPQNEIVRGWRLAPGKGIAGWTMLSGKSLIVPDTHADERYFAGVDQKTGLALRSILSVPLKVKESIIGVIQAVDVDARLFVAQDLTLLESLAAAAAIAIENARLFEQVRLGGERLQTLSRQLLRIQEKERRHIARELHDEIGQILTGLNLLLEVSARAPADTIGIRLGEAQVMIEELMERVDELSLNLRPAMLDDLGLLPTLLWHVERYMTQTGVRVKLEHTGLERRFAPDVETAAYRIVQEGLTNVARHADVREAIVRLWADQATLSVQIEDQGSGFDFQHVPRTDLSSGLNGMRERAILLGGQLTVESVPGYGTRVMAEWPLLDQSENSVA